MTLTHAPEAEEAQATQLPPVRKREEHIYVHHDAQRRRLTLLRSYRRDGQPAAEVQAYALDHPDTWRQIVQLIIHTAAHDRMIFVHGVSTRLAEMIRGLRGAGGPDRELAALLRARNSMIRVMGDGADRAIWADVISLMQRGELPTFAVGTDAHIYTCSLTDGRALYWSYLIHSHNRFLLGSGQYVAARPHHDLIDAEMVAQKEALRFVEDRSTTCIYTSSSALSAAYISTDEEFRRADMHLNSETMQSINKACRSRKLFVGFGMKPNTVLMRHARATAAALFVGREVL